MTFQQRHEEVKLAMWISGEGIGQVEITASAKVLC